MWFKFVLTLSLISAGCVFVTALPQQPDTEQTSVPTDFSDPDAISPPNTDNNLFVDQSSTQNGQESFVLDGNEQSGTSTTPISLLNTASEIREYLVSKLREIYGTLKGRKTKVDIEQATLLDFEHLPKFEEPLEVGNFTKKYKLADVTFSNVVVRGMRDFHSDDINTDQKQRTVDLELVAPSLRISGNYYLSNVFKKASGSFNVKLIDNVTYHEKSIYCRLNQEVDIADTKCGIRYGKSQNEYANLGFFTNLFRGAISNPMIDHVLQKVGREIGHKMRPILVNKLHEKVIGSSKTNSETVVPGLDTLIRGTVSEARNLLMKDGYTNFRLEGEAESVQYGTHNATLRTIWLSGINSFEITKLEMPILADEMMVSLTVHDTNVNGSANVVFVESDAIRGRTSTPIEVVLPFDIEDLRVDITWEKSLSNDLERFAISKLDAVISKINTFPPQDKTYPSQVAIALRDFLPINLQNVVTERLSALAKSHIDNILQEAALE